MSCSLICAVGAMVTSFKETLVQNAINESGYYHLQLEGADDKELQTLKNNRDIKNIHTIYDNGYGILENCQNKDKPYVSLYSMDSETFEFLKFNLIEGTFPKNENEVIISKHIIENGKVDLKLNDKISFDIGSRQTLEGAELKHSNPYNKDEEKLENVIHREFTIVGIIERPSYDFESYSSPGYTIITTNTNIGKQNAFITLKNVKEYQRAITGIMGATDYDSLWKDTNWITKHKFENFSINNELLRWEAFAFSDETVSMLYAVVGVVIFIIMFTSVFCIRNSFAIATSEKMKMYGMLASVGATKRQIKKNVIFECLMLGIVAIPLGIISGIFATFVLIKIVNLIAGEYMLGNIDGIVVKVTMMPVLISVILGIITIYLSALSSAKRASKVSPIELLRNSEKIKIKPKKLKAPKIISKLFGEGGELAYKNLKRSKKKYRTTVISISISIFIFIAMNSFLVNAFDLSNNYYKDYDYNLRMNIREISEEDIEKIVNVDGVNEKYISYKCSKDLKIFDLSKINTEGGILVVSEDARYDKEKGISVKTGKGKRACLEIIGLDNDSFIKYANKVGVDGKKLNDSGILFDSHLFYNNDKLMEARRYTYQKGDTITGEFGDSDLSIKIGAVTDVAPYGKENSNYIDGYLILNADKYKDIEFLHNALYIQADDTSKVRDELEKYDFAKSVTYTDYAERAKEDNAMNLIIKIFLYGFIAIITLIGVTNIFNTITSNMELRQKEFAMLKSVGMTSKEFNKMINLETIFYSVKALIYGIILGLLGTFAIYIAFSVKIEKGMYIPIKPILISIIAVFILVFTIMRYSIAKINKQNTIETIRNENI